MARTSVDIDEALIAEVMARYNLPSKRSAVEYALRQLAMAPVSAEEVLAMRGSGFEFTNEEIEGIG